MDMGAISGHAFLDNKGLYSMESCNGRILLDKYTNSCYYRIQTFVFKLAQHLGYRPKEEKPCKTSIFRGFFLFTNVQHLGYRLRREKTTRFLC